MKKIYALFVLPIVMSASITFASSLPDQGLLRNAPSKPTSDFREKCPERSEYDCGYTGTIITQKCSPIKFENVGAIGDTEMFYAQYQRSITFDWSTPADPKPNHYTCSGKSAYIFEGNSQTEIKPIWADFNEEHEGTTFGQFVDDVSLYHVSGNNILSVTYCVSGTGGCSQENYIRVKNVWEKMEKDQSWDVVYAEMPKEYSQHKSPGIDFKQMTWEQHIATNKDPNCCPSGKIQFELSILDNKLHVKSYKFIIPE